MVRQQNPKVEDVTAATGDSEKEANMTVNAQQDLERQVAELKAELERVKKERDQFQPFREVPVYTTPEEAIEVFGIDHLREIAEEALAKEERRLRERGRRPRWETDPDGYEKEIARLIDEIASEAVERVTKWVPDDISKIIPQRTIKLVAPNGNMVQIPIEAQINNGAGSMADPIERYKRKGFKLATPVRCALRDCWTPAAVSGGKLTYAGYCSETHRQVKEGNTLRRADGAEVTLATNARY